MVVGVAQVGVDSQRGLRFPVAHQLRDVDWPDARRQAQAGVERLRLWNDCAGADFAVGVSLLARSTAGR